MDRRNYDEIIATIDGAKGLFVDAEDWGNFDAAIQIIQDVKNRRAEQENKALTLEELRGMDGDIAWVEPYHHWVKVVPYGILYFGSKEHNDFSDYGETWLAYRHKPKEEV
jgi:hypothetical protein